MSGHHADPISIRTYVSLLERHLPAARVTHSLRVAETAKALAEALDVPELSEDAYLSGLFHDIAKATSPESLGNQFLQETQWYPRLYLHYPAVWHAFAGPKMLQQLLPPFRSEIYQAIRHHTTGAPHMTLLDHILYVADYIEPGRPFADRKVLEQLCFENKKITLATTLIVSGNILVLTQRQKAIHPLTLRCYNALSNTLDTESREHCRAHIHRYYIPT